MKLTIYTADCTGVNDNCLYPHKVEATNAGELAEAVAYDHVAALYQNSYRGNDTFIEATVIEMDCDNDHTEDPAEWVTPEKLAEDPDLGDVEFATTPSRHNMLPKGDKSARPRFHLHATMRSSRIWTTHRRRTMLHLPQAAARSWKALGTTQCHTSPDVC